MTGTTAGTLAAWAGGFEPAPRRHLAQFVADDTRAADDLSKRLAIDPDVDALAALLAARAVEPPLSVGLFGEWGSGKSFFMRRLRRRVAELASDARDSGELQKDVAWHKRIVQIEFNAWHYAEGNLWASLVEHILGNLRLADDEDEDVVQRRRRAVERADRHPAAGGRRRRVTTPRKRSESVNETRATLGVRARASWRPRTRCARSRRPRSSRRSADAVADARSAGKTLAAPRHAPSTTAAPRCDRGADVLDAARPRARPHAGGSRRSRSSCSRAPVVAWVVARFAHRGRQPGRHRRRCCGGVAAWLQRQVAWTARPPRRRPAGRGRSSARELRRGARAPATRRSAPSSSPTTPPSARLQRSRPKLAALEHELKVTTPSRMLARLDRRPRRDRRLPPPPRRARAGAARLRGDVGLPAHRGEARSTAYKTLEEEEADDDARVGRIVLYIDDLDRCEPDQVVAVLQAVHLLLAFPLFTVVVGVDVRWVERALRAAPQAPAGLRRRRRRAARLPGEDLPDPVLARAARRRHVAVDAARDARRAAPPERERADRPA